MSLPRQYTSLLYPSALVICALITFYYLRCWLVAVELIVSVIDWCLHDDTHSDLCLICGWCWLKFNDARAAADLWWKFCADSCHRSTAIATKLLAVTGEQQEYFASCRGGVVLTLQSAVSHLIMWNWYTGRWWVGCYIWYSEEGPGRGCSLPRPLLAVPNVTAHPSTASVPITVLSCFILSWSTTVPHRLSCILVRCSAVLVCP